MAFVYDGAEHTHMPHFVRSAAERDLSALGAARTWVLARKCSALSPSSGALAGSRLPWMDWL